MFWILHQTLYTHIGLIKMKEENLTYQDIRELSTNYLRSLLKEDIDVELHDMVTKELFEIREQSRPIGQSDLIINEWLLKKS